jgi:hypothetical protein
MRDKEAYWKLPGFKPPAHFSHCSRNVTCCEMYMQWRIEFYFKQEERGTSKADNRNLLLLFIGL